MPLFRGAPTGCARFYGWRGSRCVRTEVLFVKNVILHDDEGFDPRGPLLRGIRHQKSFLVAGNIDGCSSRRISIHESKVVSMEGRGATIRIGCIWGCDALGELRNRVVANWLYALVLLCDRELLADLNCCRLILSNSPEQNFPRAGLRIEIPRAIL